MVSFKTLLLPLAALATLAQAGSHAHHKRYRYRPYHNETEVTTTVITSSHFGTGIKTTEVAAVTSSTVETALLPIFTSVTTICITEYETKTYTYTLGNGQEHATTITHTNIITQNVTPVPEPTKVDYNTPGADTEQSPDYSSTTTSTTTVFVTVTHTLPLPTETTHIHPLPTETTHTLPLPTETTPTIAVEQAPQTSCPINTVYVTVPVSVSVSVIRETVVQTVKETITVTQDPISEPPVHTPPPTHPPYSNHTTQTVRQVTLTVVPIPYE